MTAPNYQAVGVGHATSVAWPAHAAGDTGYLVVSTSSAAAGALTTPAGWTPEPGFPLLVTRGFYVFSLRATSGAMGNAGLAGSGAFWGVIFTVRNGHQIFPTQCSGRVPTTVSSNPNCPGVTSLVNNILAAAIWAINSSTTGGLVSAQANATLSAFTERYDDGGGATSGALCITTGDLAAAGAIAESTATAASAGYHRATLVVNPIADIAINGTVTIDGVAAANSAGGNPKVYLHDLTQPAADYLVLDAASETNVYSLISGGTGAFAFKVPYNDHEYVAIYQDASGALYGASQKLTFSGGAFPAAVITIKTSSGGGGGASLIAANYQGDFSVRKNEPNADDRVAGPMPFYDNAGQLLTGQTFTAASGEVQIWNADTGTFANAGANTTEVAAKGLYDLQLTQAETNHSGGSLVVKLSKATYADQFYAVPLRTWQKTEADQVNTLATDYTTAKAAFLDVAISSRLAPTVAARTLDVSAGGEAGIDWANVGSPTTALNLSGTSTKAVEPTVAGRTLDISTGGEAGLDWANIGSPTTAQALTNTTLKLTAAGIAAIFDEATAAHTTAGTFGKLLTDIYAAIDTEVAAIKAKTDQLNFTGTFLDAQVRAMSVDTLTSSALAASAVTEIQTGLATSAALATAQADLDDIQARIPAALTGAGNMKADALAISGDTTAADNLELQFDGTGLTGATFPARQDAITALPALIEDAVLDALLADHVAAGTVGAALGALGNPFDQISEDSVTYGDAIRLITSVVAGVVQNFTTNTSAFKSLNGAKTRRTFTYSPLGRIAAVTGDLT